MEQGSLGLSIQAGLRRPGSAAGSSGSSRMSRFHGFLGSNRYSVVMGMGVGLPLGFGWSGILCPSPNTLVSLRSPGVSAGALSLGGVWRTLF